MAALTAFLVRVADRQEAEAALAGGADRLGLTDARGPLSLETVGAIVKAVGDRCAISAAPAVLGPSGDAAQALAATGVGAIELDAVPESASLFADLRARYPALGGTVLYPATQAGDAPTLGLFAERGFRAAMLKPTRGTGARLIEEPGIEALAQFVEAAQRRGLAAWIGGALEPPDVQRMLALRPDGLVFRASLCRDGQRHAPLDPQRIAMMRALIPRVPPADAPVFSPPDAPPGPRARDKVFVRDFVVEAGIGAYRFEHRQPQRMRFNVEADLAPIPDDVADMRDVFSYDVIVDAIRLATRRHVLLVEKIALDVATATLRDPRVRRVRVRVEKLDILSGAVGVEIERDAPI